MRTVLVVDDDPWVRVLARDSLAEDGYRTLEASDGLAATLVAVEHPGPIHLLLTDVLMPGMNGCELARTLAGWRHGIKVMFMSAYDRDFLAARGINPTGPVITKPFTTDYLVRRVGMLLSCARAPLPARPVLGRPILD
jgi:CheY-like chemotaxis protein